jgi:signal peptidase I
MSLLRIIPTDLPSRLRLAVVILLSAVLIPALFRLWCIKGLVRTIRVDGGSMAETLCGNHFRVSCGDCGITFRCDANPFPDDRKAVCPNCGYRDNELRDEDLRRGDRVLVDTWPYLWSAPRRGDIVMLVEPKDGGTASASSFAVKRVAALPREQPGISGGDLFAEGRTIRKSLSELRGMSVLVHDNDFPPHSLPSRERWLPHPPGTSDWQAIPGGFRFLSTSGQEEAQWLTYEHWHASASPAPRTQAATIQDNDSFNQAEARGLNSARDLLLRCDVRGETGDLIFTLQDPPHKITVHLQFDSSRFLVLKNGSTIIADNLPQLTRAFSLEAALCDGRLLFARNRHVLASFQYDEMPVAGERRIATGDNSSLQIGAYGGPLEISHLQVWRDIYYLAPNRLGGDWRAKAPLADDHYFLLGDNSPISIDSRHWPEGGIPGKSILGKVVPLGR